MSPLTRSNHTAARIGRWSANHWKTALVGWLVFVVASLAIGNVVGTKYLKTNDTNVGEARKADKIIAAGFKTKEDEQGEIVLIQSKTSTSQDPAFRATIDDVTTTLAQFPSVTKLKSPLAREPRDQISTDGHAVMVTFVPKGDYDHAAKYITTIESGRREGAGPASRLHGRGARQRQHAEEARREVQQHARQGRSARAAGRADHPAVRVRLRSGRDRAAPARAHRCDGDDGLVALPSQFIPVDSSIAEVDPADRPRGRGRLLAVLPPPRA